MPTARYALVLLLCLSLSGTAEKLSFAILDREVIDARLERLASKNAERQESLAALFTEAGCTVELQSVKRTKYANVLCALAGQQPDTIVIGAHFDGVRAGRAAVDNWSGAALLPSLYQVLKKSPRRHRFVLAGFAEEEAGLAGSTFYVKQSTREARAAIRAYLNVDSLGLGDLNVWLSRADPGLAASYAAVARALQLPVSAVNADKVALDDSQAFREAGIATISFHSITQKTFPILHSKRDQLAAIDREAYYRTYKVLCAYLVYLDQQP